MLFLQELGVLLQKLFGTLLLESFVTLVPLLSFGLPGPDLFLVLAFEHPCRTLQFFLDLRMFHSLGSLVIKHLLVGCELVCCKLREPILSFNYPFLALGLHEL